MKPLAQPRTKSVSDLLAPDQARAFTELVKTLRQQPDHENLLVRDEDGEILGCLYLPECHASPDDPPTDPEFLKELQRRLEFPEPALPVEDVLQFLDEYEQAEENGEHAE